MSYSSQYIGGSSSIGGSSLLGGLGNRIFDHFSARDLEKIETATAETQLQIVQAQGENSRQNALLNQQTILMAGGIAAGVVALAFGLRALTS